MSAPDFQYFANDDALSQALHDTAASKGLRNVEVACWQGDRCVQAKFATVPAPEGVQVGCLAKTLTATLVAHACAEGRLQLTDSLAHVFESVDWISEYARRLESLRVCDLLNHSHGLDASHLAVIPRAANGRIDLATLCGELLRDSTPVPVAQFFNYGTAGVWLVAAALEHLYQASYADLLRRRLLEPLQIDVHAGIDNICPALGGDLRLTARDLINLARHHLPKRNGSPESMTIDRCLASLRNQTFVPRGWHTRIRRVGLGVNDYEGNWFGHNSKFNGDSAIVRFNPELNAAIVVTSSQEEGAIAVVGDLFGGAMPQFSYRQSIKLLSQEQWHATRSDAYVGSYENKAHSIAIDVAANKSLRVRVYRKAELRQGNREPYIKRYLRAASDDVFFSHPSEPLVVPHLQFLDQCNDGRYMYLQTAAQIFRRYE